MLTIYLDSEKKQPYYEQVYQHIKEEIKNGNLKPNSKLPSSRGLAQNLNVSRSTIDTAYGQLVSEGYIEAFPKRGYFVAEIKELMNFGPTSYIPTNVKKKENTRYSVDFSLEGVDAESFPQKIWKKLMKECLAYDEGQQFTTTEPKGAIEFREAIRDYLRQSRGVVCEVENIIVGAGSQYLMMLLSSLLGKRRIGMENPAYIRGFRTLESLRQEVVACDLDEQGITISSLEEKQVNIAYVTPSHQYPLGQIMPVNRRSELLNWANYEVDRYIIEDDYDSEFRYQGKPIPALQGMDKGKKVIYIGTFSKVISPAIRMSYMVLPKSLSAKYEQQFGNFPSTISKLDQAIMSRFMNQGYFERHLNRMRNRYKQKHDVLLKELKKWGPLVKIYSANAGSHVVVEWCGSMTQEELKQSAKVSGVLVPFVEEYLIEPKLYIRPLIFFGFAQMQEETIVKGIEKLRQIWK